MAGFEQRIYESAAAALEDQERQVVEVRGLGAPLLAAGAVIASLLAEPIFHYGHPRGVIAIAAAGVGLAGCVGLLVSVVLLLSPHDLGFSVKAGATYRSLWKQGLVEQPAVDFALADMLDERRAKNARVAKRLARLLAVALAFLAIEAAGLGIAAALSS